MNLDDVPVDIYRYIFDELLVCWNSGQKIIKWHSYI